MITISLEIPACTICVCILILCDVVPLDNLKYSVVAVGHDLSMTESSSSVYFACVGSANDICCS